MSCHGFPDLHQGTKKARCGALSLPRLGAGGKKLVNPGRESSRIFEEFPEKLRPPVVPRRFFCHAGVGSLQIRHQEEPKTPFLSMDEALRKAEERITSRIERQRPPPNSKIDFASTLRRKTGHADWQSGHAPKRLRPPGASGGLSQKSRIWKGNRPWLSLPRPAKIPTGVGNHRRDGRRGLRRHGVHRHGRRHHHRRIPGEGDALREASLRSPRWCGHRRACH